MALEQWEIDLRNQLGKVSCDKEESKINIPKKDVNDNLFYISMILFFLLASIFVLDFKTDFINNIFNSSSKPVLIEKTPTEKTPTEKTPTEKTPDRAGEDFSKIIEIEEKIKAQEQKLFLLGIISNENGFIVKNGLNRKDMLLLKKDWKLTKYPKYINFSEVEKKYLEQIQNSN
jgi:hypothetical protein